MGVVYQARQRKLGRVVALKMLLPGRALRAEELVRFALEAQTLAALQHPNIVQIHEVGEAGGAPFFALEYVPGGTLARRWAGRPQPPREAAALVEMLARAIHAAHEKRVVHRDLKPANILLTADGTPKVADFSLAKELDAGFRLTETGMTAGTPGYMAPEQVRGRPGDIGPAVDVYALGVLLYEALTGRTPFPGDSGLDGMRQALEDEPVPPRRLRPGAPRDLETICLKCLEKAPRGRYATAAALADDLRRFLDGRPVAARPVGPLGRPARWVRRRPAPAALLLTAALAAFARVGGGVSLAYGARLQDERDRVRAQKEEADRLRALADAATADAEGQRRLAEGERVNAQARAAEARLYRYFAEVGLAGRAWDESDLPRLRDLLDRQPADLRGFEWNYLDRATRRGLAVVPLDAPPEGVAFSPDGNYVASFGPGGLTLRDRQTLRPLWTKPANAGHWDRKPPAFSPDGGRLALCQGKEVVIVSVPGGDALAVCKGTGATVVAAAWAADGRRVLARDGAFGCYAWAADGAPQVGRRVLPGNYHAFSPDGRHVAVYETAAVKIRNLDADARPLTLFAQSADPVTCLAYSADGRRLVTAGGDDDLAGVVRLWDTDTGKEQKRPLPPGRKAHVFGAAFSPDGGRLALALGRRQAGTGGEVVVCDLSAGQERLTLRGFPGVALGVAWSPDGRRLLTAAGDVPAPGGGGRGELRLWDVDAAPDAPLPDASAQLFNLSATADGLAAGGTLGYAVGENPIEHPIHV
jgi:WD40 repeat protein